MPLGLTPESPCPVKVLFTGRSRRRRPYDSASMRAQSFSNSISCLQKVSACVPKLFELAAPVLKDSDFPSLTSSKRTASGFSEIQPNRMATVGFWSLSLTLSIVNGGISHSPSSTANFAKYVGIMLYSSYPNQYLWHAISRRIKHQFGSLFVQRLVGYLNR